MKIHPSNKYSPNFCAHLTKKFYKDMVKADIKETEKELADYGIQADFQDSKEVAACTLQAAKIFKALNAGLPRKVITINTSPKAEENPLGMAATNGTISFNKTLFKELEFIDYLATKARENELVPSDHFLSVFIHEFIHNSNFLKMHENHENLYNIVETMKEIKAPLKLKKYILKKDGYYLPSDMMSEVFALTLEKRICSSLDETTMLPQLNPFEELYLTKPDCKKDFKFNEILKSIYEGNEEKLRENLNYFC